MTERTRGKGVGEIVGENRKGCVDDLIITLRGSVRMRNFSGNQ